MQIGIRNQRLLRILGFEPWCCCRPMFAELSIRGWIDALANRFRSPRSTEQLAEATMRRAERQIARLTAKMRRR